MDQFPIEQLVGFILRDELLMPTAAMEAILSHGEKAVPPLLTAMTEVLASRDTGRLYWATVLLGELRPPQAVPMLSEVLEQAVDDDTFLTVAAQEALGKIGAAALPELESLRKTERPEVRLWVYAAAGAIDDERARELLLRALHEDLELVEVVATALSEHGNERDIAEIFNALQQCEPWQRAELEEAIQELAARRERRRPKDWRLRYRLNPNLGGIDLSWPVISSMVRVEYVRDERTPLPLARTLDEVLARHDDAPLAEKCECCGVEYFTSTGVSVCPATAVEVAVLQVHLLGKFREEAKTDDLFDMLDAVDVELWELKFPKKTWRAKLRRARAELKDKLEVQRGACIWAIERGLSSVSAAQAALMAETHRLEDLYGDPAGLLQPAVKVAQAAHTVGRNDPCPCGSGRKYKKCCALQPAASSAEPESTLPTFVTHEGTALSFSSAHYTVLDETAVRRALAQSAEFEADPIDGSYVWIEQRSSGELGVLGTVRINGSALVLECMSEERLARGKSLLASIAGDWLKHRLNTTQDPWQAVANSPAPPRPERDHISADHADMIQSIMHRHYRNWLDEPLPALGGRTARECTRDAGGRLEVAELLRSMEEMEARKPASQRYNFTWLWSELGLERATSSH
jgi:hypothetical protein